MQSKTENQSNKKFMYRLFWRWNFFPLLFFLFFFFFLELFRKFRNDWSLPTFSYLIFWYTALWKTASHSTLWRACSRTCCWCVSSPSLRTRLNHKAYTILEYSTTRTTMNKNFKARQVIPVIILLSSDNTEMQELELTSLSKLRGREGILYITAKIHIPGIIT